MKTIKGIILGLILAASLTYAYTYTYTNEQIQALLDAVNARISTSVGAADAGKMVKTNASGVLDATLVGSITDGSINPADLNFVVAPSAGSDEYAVTYEHSTEQFELTAIPGGGDITTVGLCVTGDCTDDFINGTDIVDDAIDSEHYATGSIDALHLSTGSVTSAKILDDTIDSVDYAADSIDDEHINWGSGAGQVDYSDITTGNISTAGTAATGNLTVTGTGSFSSTVATGALTVTGLVNTSIGIDAVGAVDLDYGSADVTDHTFLTDGTGTAEIVLPAGSIDGTEILDDTIDSADYAAASIDPEHLNFVVAPAAGSDEYAVTYEHSTGQFELVAIPGGGDITTVGLCVTGDCTDDFINGTDIADDSIDSEHYVAGSIDLEHMSANSVDSDQYVDGSIDLAHMSANSVDSDQYVDGSIDLIHMSANSVDSDQYVDGSIDLVHMSANSVDSDQYVDGSIDPAHINFVVAPGVGNDEYAVTYEHSTGNFELVAMTTGGTMSTVEEGDSQVGDQDIVTTDYNAGAFSISENPNTEINVTARRHKCVVIEDLTGADDDVPLGSLPVAVTLTKFWCKYKGTGTTPAVIRFSDASANMMTFNAGESQLTCVAHNTIPSEGTGLETFTASNTLIAYESLMFNVYNTPAPTTDTYEICWEYTID